MQKIKKSKFLKIACPRCHEQKIIFGRASMQIKCEKCSRLLLKTTGGKAKIQAPIIKILWH